MTENEAKISTIAEDYKTVLHEAKSMGCNDIRALYHIPIKNMELIVQALEEIQQYRTIGTVGECRAAVEKQMARKPLIGTRMSEELKPCPFCGGAMEPVVMCYQHPYGQDYLDWLKEKKILPPIMTGFNSGYVVRCYHCGAESAGRSTKELAAKMWNRRVNDGKAD